MPDWQEILSRDGPAAWRTVYRLLGNRAEADECFQKQCLAVARSVDRLQARQRAWSRMSLFPCDQLRDDSPSLAQNAEVAELAGKLDDVVHHVWQGDKSGQLVHFWQARA